MIGVDLFSGLGGFTEGAAQNGVAVKLCANHLPLAVEWHAVNHPDTDHYCQDLMSFDWRQLPDMGDGVLLASPACQGFSEAGQPAFKRYGGKALTKHQADRNTSWAVLAALDSARPRAAVVENVLAFQRWPLFPAWCGMVEAMGYHVEVHTLNVTDFGGCQSRNRTIITIHRDRAVRIETPDVPRGCIADVLRTDGGGRWCSIDGKPERMRWRMRKAQREAGGPCVWNNVSEARGRPLDDVLPTLTTKSGSQLCLLDGERCRILDPRELARGQGFPDHYKLPTNRGEASLLIGNAIDVNMSRAVLAQVLAA